MKEVNKENEFERLLKEKADRFDMKPAPEVWQQVQDTIQKDRRRRFGWWLMAALLFAVFGTGAFFMLGKKSYPPAAPVTAENNTHQSSKAGSPSPSETNSTGKNPSAGSINDHTSSAQNRSADITPPGKKQEEALKNKSQNENSIPYLAGSESAEDLQKLIPPAAVKHDDNEGQESIALLSLKQHSLSFPEASIHELSLQQTSFDFSSIPASKHSLYFEADAMALKSFVRNHASFSPVYTATSSALPAYNSSYSFLKGYSAGGNLFFEANSKWIVGAGAHLSRTHLEAITSEQTVPQYDSVGTATGYAFDTVLVTSTQSQHAINQWLEISLMAGAKLFPGSKNHLRLLAGVGYSRLLSSEVSEQQSPYFDASVSAGLNPNVVSNSFPSYHKNQLQVFSEVTYQRDLTSLLSFTAGMQLHYYPMNLLISNELSQHMTWVGLKGGLLFRL